VDAALAEGRRNGWLVAVSVVDTHGELIAFERMDGVQYGSIDVSRQKAWTAARFRRDSKAFADGLAAGRLGSLSFDGVASVEGGVVIVADGRIVGAVGVSGASSAQDAQCARAGAEAAIRR
jgi:glc operon protein GlcG